MTTVIKNDYSNNDYLHAVGVARWGSGWETRDLVRRIPQRGGQGTSEEALGNYGHGSRGLQVRDQKSESESVKGNRQAQTLRQGRAPLRRKAKRYVWRIEGAASGLDWMHLGSAVPGPGPGPGPLKGCTGTDIYRPRLHWFLSRPNTPRGRPLVSVSNPTNPKEIML
jgi:hypothetical protein